MREERSRKINYISKVKIEFGEGGRAGNARLFLFGVALPLQSPGNGRNFKRKFTNEGDFPSLPSPAPTRLQRGRGEGKIAPRGVVFRAFSTGLCPAGRPPATFLEYLSFSFFFFFPRARRTRSMEIQGGRGGGGRRLVHEIELRPRGRKCVFPATRFSIRALSCLVPLLPPPPLAYFPQESTTVSNRGRYTSIHGTMIFLLP